MKREPIGSIFTDVASILVGDPCKVLRQDTVGSITYDQFIEKRHPSVPGTPVWDLPVPTQHVTFGDDAIAISTVGPSDGWCNVYVERDKDGVAVRLIVDLNAKVEPCL